MEGSGKARTVGPCWQHLVLVFFSKAIVTEGYE